MIRLADVRVVRADIGAAPAFGQIPDRPVRVIVPFTPAGTSDIVARILVNAVAADFPRGIIVENKGGAGGNLGTARPRARRPTAPRWFSARSAPAAPIPRCTPIRDIDLARDFTPVILTGAVRNVMTVRKDLPATSLQEVIALARAEPGKLNFGSSGVGASNHLAPELLRGRLGIDWTHVPYRGSGPAIIDIVGGRIDVFFDNLPSILPQIRAGNVRAVAVVSEARVPELPDVPTFAEAGVPGDRDRQLVRLPGAGRHAACGRRGAERRLRQGAGRSGGPRRMAEVGVIPLGGTPERMGEHMRSEVARWGAVIRENNIRAQ